MTFSGIKEPTYEQAKLRIYLLIVELYNKYSFLLHGEHLSEYKKVIILLDAYDDPIAEAYRNVYQKEFMQFIRSIFNHTFKGNKYLNRGIITCITLVQEETILSDLNMAISTVTCDKYASYFGFTEKETAAVLEEYELGDNKELIKNWYSGFSFGAHKNIYNPLSIINFLREEKIDTFWTNANSNGFVSKLLKENNRQTKINFEKLLKNELFLYLPDEAEPQYELAFTNHETARMFYKFVRDWFIITNTSYKYFVEAMLLGDVGTMNEYMNRITLQTFDNLGTQRKEWIETERFYHGFVLRLFVELINRYVITSNYESGFQKYDVMLIPQNKEDDTFILEFRIHDS